jgi:hypothetical protein
MMEGAPPPIRRRVGVGEEVTMACFSPSYSSTSPPPSSKVDSNSSYSSNFEKRLSLTSSSSSSMTNLAYYSIGNSESKAQSEKVTRSKRRSSKKGPRRRTVVKASVPSLNMNSSVHAKERSSRIGSCDSEFVDFQDSNPSMI